MPHAIDRPQPACGAPAEIVGRWGWAFTPTLDAVTAQPSPAARPTPALGVTVG